MKVDFTNVISGLFLFCLGILISNIAEIPILKMFKISDIISVVGVLIGLEALNTWKRQFSYTQRHNKIESLEKSFRNCLKSFYKYGEEYLKLVKKDELSKMHSVEQCHEFRRQLMDYRVSWSSTEELLTKKNFANFIFKPDLLQKELYTYFSFIHSRNENNTSYEPDMMKFHEAMAGLQENGLKSIRNLKNS